VNADTDDDEVFFIEDLVHQCGHVIFNAIAFDKKALLVVDPDTPLREFTGITQESRTTLDTLHGIFTETAMCQCLDIWYENHVFSGRQEHELLGRFAYILKRFNCDLQNLEHRQIFTDNGFLLYRWYLSVFDRLYQKRGDLLRELKIGNQPYKFNYEKFAALNPIGSTSG
jgi:hypothetical protein